MPLWNSRKWTHIMINSRLKSRDYNVSTVDIIAFLHFILSSDYSNNLLLSYNLIVFSKKVYCLKRKYWFAVITCVPLDGMWLVVSAVCLSAGLLPDHEPQLVPKPDQGAALPLPPELQALCGWQWHPVPGKVPVHSDTNIHTQTHVYRETHKPS